MNLAHYLLQANIYLIVFYGFYRLLLDRETYFMLNRIYLLSAACFSLLTPFLRLDWFTAQPVTQNVSVGVSQLYMVSGINDNTGLALTWGDAIAWLYVIGLCFFLGRFIMQLLSIRKLTHNIPEGTAFSFFNKLFIHSNLPKQDVISRHEQIHMRQMHSLDVIFFELLGAFTWFNPVVYFYKQSIKNIHEYLADEEAANYQGDKEQYALLLLSTAFGINPSTITNSFFNKSMIKKRITMLHKQKSKKTAILKYGMFVPLFGLTLILSSATIRQNENIRVAAESIPLDQPLKVVTDILPTTISKPENRQANVIMHPNIWTYQEKVFDFVSVDTPPSFPGGIEKFYAFIGKSIKYPQEAVKNNVQGKVFLSFIVEKDGSLSHINVDQRLGSGTDEEAVRVLESSPRWTPGLKDKKPVRVKYNMPISFTLSNPKASNGKLPANVIYTIDGKNATSEEAQSLAPNTIESINVIKAANAAHTEGTTVKKDMIIIKTKAAKGDATTVSPAKK